jgi:hypothetical protein
MTTRPDPEPPTYGTLDQHPSTPLSSPTDDMAPKPPMEKLARASMGYTMFGLAAGVYWRELTRHLGYVSNGTSQLRVMHTHCFSLGTFFFLFVLILEKNFKLSKHKDYKKFYITYNIGIGITLTMILVHGTLTVIDKDPKSRLISWTAGAGHTITAVGFYYFYKILLNAVRADSDKPDKKPQESS